MRVTVTGPNLVANRRSRSSWATPRRCPSASTTSTRRRSRTARRSRLSCNSWRSKASPSTCSRSSNSPWVIPAAWSPVNHATNPSNLVDDAANAASTVSDAYACIRLLLRRCSGVGTDEPNGEGATLTHDTPTNGSSSLSHAHLQKSHTHQIIRQTLEDEAGRLQRHQHHGAAVHAAARSRRRPAHRPQPVPQHPDHHHTSTRTADRNARAGEHDRGPYPAIRRTGPRHHRRVHRH